VTFRNGPRLFSPLSELNDSAVAVLGDEKLRTIARELVVAVKRNATIDWTLKESVQAKLRVIERIEPANGLLRTRFIGPRSLSSASLA
jgi:Domain of unknown function (DUF3387)